MCVPDLCASFHHDVKYSMNTVKTKYGPLRGIIVRSNPTVEAFLGVPYASPPVGSLRFMPPVTPSTWKSIRLADRYSSVCPQAFPSLPDGPEALLDVPRGRLAQLNRLLPLLANQSEDCLYLNLYVPRPTYPIMPPSSNYNGNSDFFTTNAKISNFDGVNSNRNKINEQHFNTADSSQYKLLPAIVYIHGESYEWNSGNPYDGSVLAAHGNLIVITINFRLGILGFLKTGTKGSTQGNFGLMDLVAGLHWLRENLPAFGGDPEKVTIMGHGTGAALANILVVSPVASDLVRRAILLSGSALSPWALQKDPLMIKRRVAEETGCHGHLLDDDLAPCLRTKPISELLTVKIDEPRFLPGFAPFIDGTVVLNPSGSGSSVPLPPGSAIASTSGIEMADFPTRELIFGLTTIESYLDFNAQDLEFGFNETRRDRILRTYVRNVYHYHLNEIYAALKNEYTDWERIIRNPMAARDASLEFLSDGHTAAPLVRLGYLHSLRGGKTYFLHFRHQSGERDFPQRSGSVRGEDVPFCLGLPISPLFPYNYTKEDIEISRILVRYLSNFALNGNPNDTPITSHDISQIVHNSKSGLIQHSSFLLPSASLTLETSSSSITSSLRSPFDDVLLPSPHQSSISKEFTSSVFLPNVVIEPMKHNNNVQQYSHASILSEKSITPVSLSSDAVLLTSSSITQKSPSVVSGMMPSSSTSTISLTSPSDSMTLSSSTLYSIFSSNFSDKVPSNTLNNDTSLQISSLVSNLKRHSIENILQRRKRKTVKYETRKHLSNISSNKFLRQKMYPSSDDIKLHTNNNPKNSDGLFVADQEITSSSMGSDTVEGHYSYQQEQKQHHLHHHHHHHYDGSDEEDEDENDDENIEEEEDDNDDDDDEIEDEILGAENEFKIKNHNNENNSHDYKNEEDTNIDGDLDDDNGDEKNLVKYDRFDNIKISKLPFWNSYDAINQIYLELGNKVEIRNHYRGHKLSMWLSLVPQLHSPIDLNDLPMRHHHFAEENAEFYDGIVRPQTTQKPNFPKLNIQQSSGPQTSFHPTTTPKTNLISPVNNRVPATTTECPPNTTVVPTIAATRPQNHQQNNSGPSSVMSPPLSPAINKPLDGTSTNNNLLRRLANTQYQSYTTALLVTVAVGCFLLILNILIFVGIYYQREKRANDARKKEELQEAENRCSGSPTIEKITHGNKSSRKSSLQSLTSFDIGGGGDGVGISGNFSEYTCYEEKLQYKEKHALADICSVELPLKEFKCSPSPVPSTTGSLKRSTNTLSTTSNILMYPPTYHNTQHHQQQQQKQQQQQQQLHHNPHKLMHHHFPEQQLQSCSNNGLVTYQQFHQKSSQKHSLLHTHSATVPPSSIAATATTTVTATSIGTSTELCNQSTQSEQPTVQDVGTSVDEKVVGTIGSLSTTAKKDGTKSFKDDNNSQTLNEKNIVQNSDIPEPPPPPKSTVPYQGGILRQPGPPTTPGSNKKRVQIQEISV